MRLLCRRCDLGLRFEHRMSDWLARFIRSYQVVEGNTVRLAVPPTFGGSGVAAEDIDNDGDIDLLILGGAGNALYLNDGKGNFKDVTESAGLDWKRADTRRSKGASSSAAAPTATPAGLALIAVMTSARFLKVE